MNILCLRENIQGKKKLAKGLTKCWNSDLTREGMVVVHRIKEKLIRYGLSEVLLGH